MGYNRLHTFCIRCCDYQVVGIYYVTKWTSMFNIAYLWFTFVFTSRIDVEVPIFFPFVVFNFVG